MECFFKKYKFFLKKLLTNRKQWRIMLSKDVKKGGKCQERREMSRK